MATGAPDWQKVVTIETSVTAGAPDWERVVVGPGGVPVAGGTPNTWFKVTADHTMISADLSIPWEPDWDPTTVSGAGGGMSVNVGDNTRIDVAVPGIWEIVVECGINWTTSGAGLLSGVFAYNLIPTPVGAHSDFLVNNPGIVNPAFAVTFGSATTNMGIVNTMPWIGYLAVGDHFGWEISVKWLTGGTVAGDVDTHLFCRLLNAVTY